MASRATAAARAVDPGPGPRLSPLYARFNGFCLGAFVGGAQQPWAQPRYDALRTRVHEFLDEVGIALRLPARAADFVAAYPTLVPALKAQLQQRSPELRVCCALGELATLFAGGYLGTTPALRRHLKAQAVPALQQLGLAPVAYERFARGLARAARTRDANALVTQVYLLLADLLEPLGPEIGTAFVAMPFAPPYAGYFAALYRPALAAAGFRALRAWGGLVEEEYYPFIAPLVARCALVLADLSAHNLNVANEVGLAHGANRPAVLLMGTDAGLPPSNLADLAVLRYDPAAPGWPQPAVRTLAKFVRLHWRAYVASISHDDLIPTAAQRLQELLQAAGRPVPRAVRSLAHAARRNGG